MPRPVKMMSTLLTMVVFAVVPLTAAAREPVTDTVRAENVDESAELMRDRPADQKVDRVRERLTDRRPVLDRRSDRIDEPEVDGPIDRCRIVDNPRRCLDDERPHDINVRHLIWRLIKAHEWEKLVRLLHWLGWL